MDKRSLAVVFGCIGVTLAILMSLLVDSASVFSITLFVGCIGTLLVAWGSKYFLRNYPDTARGTPNSREKCVELTRELLEGARKSIRIVGGELHHGFWKNKEITRALKEAVSKHGVKVEIICGPKFDEENTVLRDLVGKHDGIVLRNLSYNPKRHFMVVDEKGVRLEKEHPIPLSKSDDLVATVYNDRPYLAYQLNETFNSLKDKLDPVVEKK